MIPAKINNLIYSFLLQHQIITNCYNYIKIKHYIFNLYSNRTLQAVILPFSNYPILKEKEVWCDPLCFIIVISLSLSLSGVVNFSLKCKLRTYALHIFHTILIWTYVHQQTYIDSHLPKQVITN